MKFLKINPLRCTIMLSFINCLIVFICLLFYINKVKFSYFYVIFIITLVLVLSAISLLISIKTKYYIKKCEDKLEMFEAIIESAPNAILIHRKLKFIYANNKAKELFNLDNNSEIIGKPVENFVNLNKDVIGSKRLESALNETDFEPLIEEVFFNKNGQVVELQIISAPIKIGRGICVLNLCTNITEKKRIMELERKIEQEEKKLREKIELEKLKEEFFANLSHEIRTPITIILGTIQLIEKNLNVQDYNQEKNYKMLKQNSYRLLKLVNNLLDITKIDSGHFSINMDNNNIVSIVEDSTLSIANYVKANGLNIIFDTNTEEKIISCDIDSIERIMLNLLSNAIKFTPKGGTIFVNVVDEEDSVKIIIRDTGIGIKEENFNLVFDRFRQIDKSFTRNHEGSGIGLSIVKSLVEMSGGAISLISEYGKGSEFTITLPANIIKGGEAVNEAIEKGKFINEKVNIELSDI
ncbi:PAS domain-containing sensor histidine kinase [Clostridium sp. CS001]|uniref:PAS domain-containing sensor histidine kinase n=1 Tax=Clostridium sp. CS001 TaxID=2880648 RepID=UPI001CF337CE|nr:PAS domain-containing sensor histidine kinase [Clostridium sp. CS001]MCB2289837.1 PAS domain-containing sensor histidine kinase [Clostridium sp. CS001]